MRLASVNLLHGIDLADGRVDLAPTVRLLRRLEVDVVALQEVDRGLARSGGVDQAAVLGEALGMHAVFAPALIGSPDTAWEVPHGLEDDRPGYGVALLSREAVQARAVRLPGGGAHRRTREPSLQRPGWDREPRVALVADTDGVRIATTHLSYLPWRALRQLRRVAAACDGAAAAVVIGDLNLPPAAVRRALGRWTHAGGPPTYPAWQPRVQLDQVLSRGDVAVRDLDVGERGPSDHLPLVATAEILT